MRLHHEPVTNDVPSDLIRRASADACTRQLRTNPDRRAPRQWPAGHAAQRQIPKAPRCTFDSCAAIAVVACSRIKASEVSERAILTERAAALVLKRSDIQEPRATEEPARRRHFHLHLLFASVIADDLHGQWVHKLPALPLGKYLVLKRS